MAKLTNEGLLQKIQTAINAVKQLKNDRADTNAEIAAVRANMEALGIPKPAFDMAVKYINMDPEDREGFDVNEKTKGKRVLASALGEGAIN